jgi:hypothetical protein
LTTKNFRRSAAPSVSKFCNRDFSFSGYGFLNLTWVLLFFRLPGQIPSGSPFTNFWLLYTFKVRNIVFLEKFSFWLVVLMFRQFFLHFGLSLQIPSCSPHKNFWLLFTFKDLNILFFVKNFFLISRFSLPVTFLGFWV